jgi:hypothetical protein
MATPSIPHFGTTLYEEAPPAGLAQQEIPFTGQLERTHRFLTHLGAEIAIRNFYGPEIGRQYIYKRGQVSDLDYFEKDSFTSYTSAFMPPSPRPRVGEAIFRVVHRDVRTVYRALLAEDLIRPIGPDGDTERFLAGEQRGVLVMGPDEQRYELSEVRPTRVENHAIFLWTTPDPDVLRTKIRAFDAQFDIVDRSGEWEDFHGIGRVRMLTRTDPPVSIGILVPNDGQPLAPRWTDDIFKQVGYSHFRLGSPRKEFVRTHHQQVFPDTGDVSYVMFHDAYLELVQTGES